MSIKKYLPEVHELVNLIVLKLRPSLDEAIDERLKEIEEKLGLDRSVTVLVRKNFQSDYEKLSGLPPSCHKVFNFIIKNGPSDIYKIRRELIIQGEKRMPLSTIYFALRKLRQGPS
jgi:hypothetical protein